MKPVEGPRLLPAPAALDRPELLDETEWAGVAVTGDVGGDPEVDSVDITASVLAGLRLTGRRIDGLHMVDVLVEDCDLSGVVMPSASLRRVKFRRCRMSGLSAPNLRAQHVRITDCRADGSSFRMSAWDAAELSEVNLRSAEFHHAKLAGVRLLGCDLSGADFSHAATSAVALHGSTLDGLVGAGGLRGLVIGSDQVLALALRVFASSGIVVDDDYVSGPVERHLP